MGILLFSLNVDVIVEVMKLKEANFFTQIGI